MSEDFDSSLNTLKPVIINQLQIHRTEKPDKYPLSYSARIINRSIPDRNAMHHPKLRRGHYSNLDTSSSAAHSIITYTREDLVLKYNGIVFPGTKHGEKIMKSLDQMTEHTQMPQLTEREIYQLAAFVTTVTCSTHPFVDANGRTSVALADLILRQYLGKKLNYEKLNANNNDLMINMVRPTIELFLPEHYKAENVFKYMQFESTQTKIINIPMFGIDWNEEANEFLDQFAESIIEQIENYSPTKYISELAPLVKLYEECSVPCTGDSSPNQLAKEASELNIGI